MRVGVVTQALKPTKVASKAVSEAGRPRAGAGRWGRVGEKGALALMVSRCGWYCQMGSDGAQCRLRIRFVNSCDGQAQVSIVF
ncbi:hypothetical protein C1O66_02220 [Paucibacter aquatile]|uniref:Uncharacterized protein n=1 Tax=Kinneretia aquatilis TaxID=2070761 RepID=A0A2N8L3F1_9BURK|nr:hypothetical protein C1O66_02220 [Paucibacter aquatile]